MNDDWLYNGVGIDLTLNISQSPSLPPVYSVLMPILSQYRETTIKHINFFHNTLPYNCIGSCYMCYSLLYSFGF